MKRFIFLSLVLFLGLTGCKQKIDQPEMEQDLAEMEQEEESVHLELDPVEVDLINEDGVSVGMAQIVPKGEGVEIQLDAHHLKPGLRGFHIHERGVCDAPSFESAGAHFNPTNKKHGFDHPEGHHAGDMENIEVQEDGSLSLTITNPHVTLQKNKPHSLWQKEGTSLVIHEQGDDYLSQPAGDAGERIVCGVITKPKDRDKKH